MERLICTVKRDGDARQQSNAEFLLYRPEHVLGLTFDAGGVLSFLSSCQYEDGEPARYETALFSTASGEPRCIELQREISVCEAGVLRILDWYRYAPDLHLEQMRYTFTRDTEGKLSTYTAEEILGFRAGCTPPREYRVRGNIQ